jgi:uncharacterized membrane protein YsdA (DUF1294 family)
MLLLYLIFIVYILAINFYAVIRLKTERDNFGDNDEKLHRSDGKLILTGLLGGAIGVYVGMFLLKFRLNNMLLMILMPVLSVLNVYFFVVAFRSGFTFFIV